MSSVPRKRASGNEAADILRFTWALLTRPEEFRRSPPRPQTGIRAPARPIELPGGRPVACAAPAADGPPAEPAAPDLLPGDGRFQPGDLVMWVADDEERTLEGEFRGMSTRVAWCAVVRRGTRLEAVALDRLALIGKGGAA